MLELLAVTQGCIFSSKRNPTGHIPGDMLSQSLRAAETKAKLPKVNGGMWHPYRRKWASERIHLPLKPVADAGGWKDLTTLMQCYQHADEAALLAMMEDEPLSIAAGRAS